MKNQDNEKDLLKDIKSVPKASKEQGKDDLNQSEKPAKGGRFDAKSTQDGGQDSGSSAGSH